MSIFERAIDGQVEHTDQAADDVRGERIVDVYTTYRAPLLRYIERMIGKADAEDLLHEVFIRLERARPGKISGWLFRSAKNACIDFVRVHRRRSEIVEQSAPLIAARREQADETFVQRLFQYATELDTEGDYSLLLFMLLDVDADQKRTAEALDLSTRTVRRMQSKLFAHMRTRLEESGFEYEDFL